jgi:molybdenum cofactor biosynthesis protein B
MAGIDANRAFIPLKIAVLTVSDTRELADDKSGATLLERIEKAGHTVADRAIVTDDIEAIRSRRSKTWIADSRNRRDHHDRRHRFYRPRRDPRSD